MTWVGWLSSAVLLATIAYQVTVHWRARRNGGVSRWLYYGQVAASTGFLAYSLSLSNWVFVVTNALLVVTAVVGALIHRHHERPHQGRSPAVTDPAVAPSAARSKS